MMNQQSSSQSSLGNQSKPPQCYNCGAGDHFMMACPEQARQIPAGLAAARAAEAAQSSDAAYNSQSGYGERHFKRQKTGPVVTRFPAPPTGPVITHYAPPATQASPYAGNANSGYYDAPVPQPYQQHHLPQSQPYIPYVPPQQSMSNHGYSPQQMQTMSQGYIPPLMTPSPQGFSQLPTQPMSQYGYQNFQGGPYQDSHPAAPISQQYGYGSSMHYGQQPIVGQAPQNYHAFQGQPPFNGQAMQNYPTYQGQPPIQSFGHSILAHDQTGMQNWSQPPAGPQAFPTVTYLPENTQYHKPYQNQYRKRPYQHPPYQAPPHLGNQGDSETTPTPFPASSIPQQVFNPAIKSQPFQKHPGRPRSFSVTTLQPQRAAQPPQPSVAEGMTEEADFRWDLEKIFAEELQKDADPIDRPLPTVYNEEPILPPAYNARAIIGKYVRPNNLEIFARDIRLSLHWPSLKADPVFNEIDFCSPLIPLDDIESWIQRRQSRSTLAESVQNSGQASSVFERARSEEQELNSRNVRSNAFPERHMSMIHQASQVSTDRASDLARPLRDVTPTVNQCFTPPLVRSSTPFLGADDDVWAPQPGEGQIVTSPAPDPTEALLASLGVTGSPKPATQSNTRLGSPLYMDEMSQDFYSRIPVRHDSGYVSQRGSISNETRNVADNQSSYGEYRPTYNGGNPPPPPPPPSHKRRQVDGAMDSPSSDSSGQYRNAATVSQNEVYTGSRQESSPLTPTSAGSIAHECSVLQEHRVVKKPATLRQVDDVTPKLKRRQPQVAEAYSRRW